MIRNLFVTLKEKLLKSFMANKAEKQEKNTARDCKEVLQVLSGIFQDDDRCATQQVWKEFYLSDTFLYSSIESILMLPSDLICGCATGIHKESEKVCRE